MKYEYISHIPNQLEQAGYKPKSVKKMINLLKFEQTNADLPLAKPVH